MTTQHTPAPWTYAQVNASGQWQYGVMQEKSNGEGICQLNNEANARLIAGSPTLYEYAVKHAKSGDKEAQSMLDSLQLGY